MTVDKGQCVEISWASLVERARTGDSAACQKLFGSLADHARACLSWDVDPQVVDDNLQDVLVRLLEAIQRGQIREPNHLRGFVRTLARRSVFHHIRTNIRSRSHLVPIAGMDFAAPADQSPDAVIARRQHTEAMQRVLCSLSVRDREILTRFYLEEQSPEQICLEMRLTSTQFRLYKSRALARCSLRAGRGEDSTRPIPAELRTA
jgi:RNA polymerase sigma factor (sigma-70 family)